MRQTSNRGFTLVELLVVIAIIGTLVGLLLPAVQAAREAARSNTCRNNMTQLHKGLAQRESSLGEFPGYIDELGIRGTADRIRASWVVFTFPYIEQQQLYDLWANPNNSDPTYINTLMNAEVLTELEILLCPSDPPVTPGAPNLSYGANAGFVQNSHEFDVPTGENAANGVFFDRTRAVSGANLLGPVDEYEDPQDFPKISMTMAYIQQKGDGSTSTIMLSENIHLVYWAHRFASGTAPYTYSGSVRPTSDEKWHFGICWEQPGNVSVTTPRRINGDLVENQYEEVYQITNEDNLLSPGRYQRAMPNAYHPAGINITFVGGSVRFVSDQIDPTIYAQLMTSNRNRSDLVAGGVKEVNLPPVSDSDF